MKHVRWGLEALVLGGLFACAFRFPGAWGGVLEPLCALLFPLLLLEATLRGRPAIHLWLAFLAGLIAIFHWVPATLVSKGGLSEGLGLLGGLLFWAYEAAGFLLVALLARFGFRRRGAWAAAACAAFGILAWESFAFHIYTWSWGAPFGSLPLLARSAAFLTSPGLAALVWGSAAWGAARLAQDRPFEAWRGPAFAPALMLLLGGAWSLLPRTEAHALDIAVVQPDFPAGERFPGMEEEMLRRSEALLTEHHLPRTGARTLLLWSESAVLGREHSLPDDALSSWVKERNIALLFGTEGGRPATDRRGLPAWEPGVFNLVRGEVEGHAPFLQAKVIPMAFGERMPGPAWMRERLDHLMGLRSQEPGELTAQSAFAVPTPTGVVRVHPLICSEALLPDRAREGAVLTGADLLTNHTNDNWFERSPATFLHAAQIRLRPVELGLPMVRVTLGGASGFFHEDGRFELWSGPRTQGAWAFPLAWRPVRTPARSPWLFWALALGTGAAALVLSWPLRTRTDGR